MTIPAFLTPILPLAAEKGGSMSDKAIGHIKDHWHRIGAEYDEAGHAIYGTGIPIISNHIIIMLIVAAVMLAIFIPLGRRYREGQEVVPSKKANFFEAIMLYMRDDVAKPVLGDATGRYIPLLWTLFFFILFNNLLGLLPLEPLQRG